MPRSKTRRIPTATLSLVSAGLVAFALSTVTARAAAPFAGMEGKWSGDGSIVLTNGATERLRCDATYVVSGGGENLDQSLRCHSDSYDFDLRTSLVDKAGAIVGNWNEVTKSVTGGIVGRNQDGVIQVTVRGQTFQAAVSVATHASEQAVTIRAASGDLSQVSITLHRAR